VYAPVPPPLNLLRIPYELFALVYKLYSCMLPSRSELPNHATEPLFILPDDWKAAYPMEALAEQIADFMHSKNADKRHADKQIADFMPNIVSAIAEKQEKESSMILDKVAELASSLAAMQVQLDRLTSLGNEGGGERCEGGEPRRQRRTRKESEAKSAAGLIARSTSMPFLQFLPEAQTNAELDTGWSPRQRMANSSRQRLVGGEQKLREASETRCQSDLALAQKQADGGGEPRQKTRVRVRVKTSSRAASLG